MQWSGEAADCQCNARYKRCYFQRAILIQFGPGDLKVLMDELRFPRATFQYDISMNGILYVLHTGFTQHSLPHDLPS